MFDQILTTTSVSLSLTDIADALIITLSALLFGMLLRLTFHAYFRVNEPIDVSIPRSFALICPGVAIIFFLIQTSLPLSLGLLGALSFVRFRTPVKRAEDIGFILILIGGGLSCAIKEFAVAAILLAVISAYGFARNRYGILAGEGRQTAILTFSTSRSINVGELVGTISGISRYSTLLSQSTHDGITSVVFNISKMRPADQSIVSDALRQLDQQGRVEFFFPDNQIGAF